MCVCARVSVVQVSAVRVCGFSVWCVRVLDATFSPASEPRASLYKAGARLYEELNSYSFKKSWLERAKARIP